jgi:transcriptional regulator with XRE-family HTH domain
MVPGGSLRQIRERLGLTYRDVERASYEVAQRRGRPDFIIRLSRLADIENGGVTPSLYKLYSLCAIYHLNLFEVCNWFDVPLTEYLRDAVEQPAPKTHLLASLSEPQTPAAPGAPPEPAPRLTPSGPPASGHTAPLKHPPEEWNTLAVALFDRPWRYRLGFIGTDDHWMEPLVRPGSIVLFDPTLRRVENSGWTNEFNRPIYFIELRDGYRCCWCARARDRLVLQPHPLSPCTPETPKFPDEAEVIGQVVGMATRLFAA